MRDRDAHSWVEAWFDGIGWVTFDPTPTATPARSLIAALDEPDAGSASDSPPTPPAHQPGTRNPAGARRELDPRAGRAARAWSRSTTARACGCTPPPAS